MTRTWAEILAANPDHSAHYAARWERLAAEGRDLDGEARMVARRCRPGAAILDAGCGTGRVGGYLLAHGYAVSGVDIDAYLIDYARQHYPDGQWLLGDLARADYEQLSAAGRHEVVVAAGNVMAFIDPADRAVVLRNLAAQLAPGGVLISGFGLDRGLSAAEYHRHATAAGLVERERFSTWEEDPFGPEDSFLVAVYERP